MRPVMEAIKAPGEWPPPGWPACPDPERYRAAVRRHEENMSRWRSTPPVRGEEDGQESGMIMAADLARILCGQSMSEMERSGRKHGLADLFMAAARLTSEQVIGAVFIRERPGGRSDDVSASFDILHRHPEWTGLCAGLAEAEGLEALIFWNADHEPDVVMALPGRFLGADPREAPRCSASWEARSQGLNLTLMEVLRYHGASPHPIDLCLGNGMGLLAGLMSGKQRAEAGS